VSDRHRGPRGSPARKIKSYFFISFDGVVESPDEPTTGLELLSAQTFKTGVLNLRYAPAKG
jgi:hypothetical protein